MPIFAAAQLSEIIGKYCNINSHQSKQNWIESLFDLTPPYSDLFIFFFFTVFLFWFWHPMQVYHVCFPTAFSMSKISLLWPVVLNQYYCQFVFYSLPILIILLSCLSESKCNFPWTIYVTLSYPVHHLSLVHHELICFIYAFIFEFLVHSTWCSILIDSPECQFSIFMHLLFILTICMLHVAVILSVTSSTSSLVSLKSTFNSHA